MSLTRHLSDAVSELEREAETMESAARHVVEALSDEETRTSEILLGSASSRRWRSRSVSASGVAFSRGRSPGGGRGLRMENLSHGGRLSPVEREDGGWKHSPSGDGGFVGREAAAVGGGGGTERSPSEVYRGGRDGSAQSQWSVERRVG